MEHWINTYIGLPWAGGAKGPDSYDCYGLVQAVMMDRYKVVMPDVAVDHQNLIKVCRALKTSDNWAVWDRIMHPSDGALVKMIKHKTPDHIGVWVDVDGGGVLHASQACGVVFDNPFTLTCLGWRTLEFYRHRGTDA